MPEASTESRTQAMALDGHSSATSALGAFLSAGNHHGPATGASVPSHTSRYFSVNFGLTHLVALSLKLGSHQSARDRVRRAIGLPMRTTQPAAARAW